MPPFLHNDPALILASLTEWQRLHRQQVTAAAWIWFVPAFDPPCGLMLLQDGSGAWGGWWLAEVRGEPYRARFTSFPVSREPCGLAPEEIAGLAARLERLSVPPEPGARQIFLDGCTFQVRSGDRERSNHLSASAEREVRAFTVELCGTAERAEWEATRGAFSQLRRYLP